MTIVITAPQWFGIMLAVLVCLHSLNLIADMVRKYYEWKKRKMENGRI